jgi:hypothetical protein
MPVSPPESGKEMTTMPYTVYVDDNFHYMDENERYKLGDFETLEAAIDACKKIVDQSLTYLHERGMTAAELYEKYTFAGEDPWVSGGSIVPFCAWDYAKQNSEMISGSAPSTPSGRN